jgi:hypothetical protein
VFCKSYEPEIVFVLICTQADQFHVHKSHKTRESTLSCIGNFEENIYLSHIHLAVRTRQICKSFYQININFHNEEANA